MVIIIVKGRLVMKGLCQASEVENRVASYLLSYYVHNEANELVEDEHWTYRYDGDGNMVERVCRAGVKGGWQRIERDGGPEVRRERVRGVKAGVTCEPGERWEYVYNAENTLMAVYRYVGTDLKMEAHYAYDAVGRRVEKVVVNHETGERTHRQYTYRDEDWVIEWAVDPATGERKVWSHVHHGTMGVDDPVAVLSCPDGNGMARGWWPYAKDQLNSS